MSRPTLLTVRSWRAAITIAAAAVVLVVSLGAQQPTFRSAVDVIAVDVQIVDSNGRPIPRLGVDLFDVQINGQQRRVLSADFIEHADADAPERRPQSQIDGARPDTTPPRVYVIGVDVASFNVAESRAVIQGAREFIKRVQPEDMVGIYAFPIGPKFRPSTNHPSIIRSLETIVGSRDASQDSPGLSAMDAIDIMAETTKADLALVTRPQTAGRGGALVENSNSETLNEVVARECGPEDRPCAQAIFAEARRMSFSLQGRAVQSLSGLRELIRGMGTIDGRKTLILLSAGMPVSDWPGGQPDVGDFPRLLGQDAAGTNTTIYTLFLETGFFEMQSVKSAHPPRWFADGREHAVFGRVMDEFTGASGGALLPVAQGTGLAQLERVLRETSSHYLLGVQPAQNDRDGTVRRLQVNVKRLPRGASIRSRLWVVIPKAKA